MNLLKTTCVVIFISLLAACGDSDTVAIVDDAAQSDQNAGAGEKKPILFQDMKDSLDEAKAVNSSMQKHNEQQKKDLDGI
ncbi:MAG: hypothetical protein IMF15_05500 [Proteobacteria bacterium]|nr:hypothetical protein [Pseudomonadota bacterium]